MRAMQNPKLKALQACFVLENKDIRFVGGCVRDHLLGIEEKDTDFCTDANPDEQIAIYKKYGYKFIPTGLDHGTITVMIDDEGYEITSLRTEQNHDGRHAEVSYTHNWLEDLSRRDLTFNAMSMTFDGELFDPFGGEADLRAGRCVFVGNAIGRITEDYLRILRWFRFYGRFGKMFGREALESEDMAETLHAIRSLAPNLKIISRERVWMEVSKIITGPNAFDVVMLMTALNVDEALGTHFHANPRFSRTIGPKSNPFTVLIGLVGPDEAVRLTKEWKLSREDMKLGSDIVRFYATPNLNYAAREHFTKEFLVHGAAAESVREFCFLNGWELELADFEVPMFPVNGYDMIEKNVPGPERAAKIKSLKTEWFNSDFTMSKEDLMKLV